MEDNILDLVIVGAGPGGISLAAEMIHAGTEKNKILALEQQEKNSWIMRKLYPEQKLVTANYKGNSPVSKGIMSFYDMSKPDALKVLDQTITKYDIPVKHGTTVHKITKDGGVFIIETKYGNFKARKCAVGIGIFGKPNKPDYKIPATLKDKTNFDITTNKIQNSEVLVVGGGDSAAEYVQHLVNDGNRVSISCREHHFELMNESNRDTMHQLHLDDKIRIIIGSNIDNIEDSSGKIKVNLKEPNISSFTIDRIVYALGGTTPSEFLKVSGVEFDNKNPKVDTNYQTTVEGLYLLGDLAQGKSGGSIIIAFNTSEKIAKTLGLNKL